MCGKLSSDTFGATHLCSLNDCVLRSFRLFWLSGHQDINDFPSLGSLTQMTSPTLASGGTQSRPGEERGVPWGFAGAGVGQSCTLQASCFILTVTPEVGQELLAARPHGCSQVEAVGVARTSWWGLRPCWSGG